MHDSLEARLKISLSELYMVMSDDFALAVLEGATAVRLGRRLFGNLLQLATVPFMLTFAPFPSI